MTEVLATLGRLIRWRHRSRPYWIHTGWLGLILLVILQMWWIEWEIQSLPELGFWAYCLTLTPYMAVVVLTYVLCPDLPTSDHANLEDYYYSALPAIFGTGAAMVALLIVVNSLLRGAPWLGVESGIRYVVLLAALVLATTSNRRVHAIGLGVCYALVVVSALLSITLGA